MSITIVRAKQEDLESILQGQKESFYDCYQRYQDHEMSPYNMTIDMMKWILENEHLYKILYDGKSVGAVYVHEEQDKYHMKLHGIFVVPGYQDKGIGQEAIALVEKEYPEALTWALETPHDLYRNHHVYEKIGYVRTGREDFVNERLTIVHYKKEVKGQLVIDFLCNNLKFINTVARWCYDEFVVKANGSLSFEKMAEYFGNTYDRALPITLVAVIEGECVGTVSLFENDLKTQNELTPWLASLYVNPAYRGRGIAALLIEKVKQISKDLGYKTLYLRTEHASEYYKRLGWEFVYKTVDEKGQETEVFRR